MKNIRFEKMIAIALIMQKENYVINNIVNRRLKNYNFQEHTTITRNEKHITISTETKIKGVYNILILYQNGMTKLDFEFN